MAKSTCKSIRLAQNFLRSAGLARALVVRAGIGSNELVYEIGPGGGRLTEALAERARRVIAVEADRVLANRLAEKFQRVHNVQVICGDFLRHNLPGSGYTIVGNIPFNRTADIVRKLTRVESRLQKAFLILQKEAAQKFAGIPAETQFSILIKPFHEFRILQSLRRTDFEPVPGVDIVFVGIEKRSPALIPPGEAGIFRQFVRLGFGAGGKDLKSAFRKLFPYLEWKALSRSLHFPLHATPTELTFEQWLGIYEHFKRVRSRHG